MKKKNLKSIKKTSRNMGRLRLFGELATTVGRTEIKTFDFNSGGVPPVGGISYCINQIAAGTDFFNRIGRHIKVVGIDFDMTFIPTATGNFDFGLAALVYDRQPNVSLATYADVYAGGPPPGISFVNLATNANRFQILKSWVCPPLNNLAGEAPRFRGTVRVPRNLVDVEYSSSSATIPSTGAFLILVGSFTNSGLMATSISTGFSTRILFTDD